MELLEPFQNTVDKRFTSMVDVWVDISIAPLIFSRTSSTHSASARSHLSNSRRAISSTSWAE
ncbi:MAG: hypothetical protein KME11_06965 [Timaviella obliquedivisa GSE-PSE-MK23-08B]|jgi:hypothetical protein|nr:hypothetical protein [Timaviella obliquedivisa GSE-PSE-MK23-08B]